MSFWTRRFKRPFDANRYDSDSRMWWFFGQSLDVLLNRNSSTDHLDRALRRIGMDLGRVTVKGPCRRPRPPVISLGAHLSTTSGFPFSTRYVASSAALPLPTCLAAWGAPAGMNKESPALSVIGGLPSN
jgi:hypothetical protein